jgi:hypothetical protein
MSEWTLVRPSHYDGGAFVTVLRSREPEWCLTINNSYVLKKSMVYASDILDSIYTWNIQPYLAAWTGGIG